MKVKIRFFILFALFLYASLAFAQTSRATYSQQSYKTDWQIRCIYSLDNGLVLCGTEGGLILFDGYKSTEIKMERFEAVNGIIKLSKTQLLLVRENTIVTLDLKDWKFTIIYKSSKYKNELFFGSMQVGNSLFLASSEGLQKWDIPKRKMTYLMSQVQTKIVNAFGTRGNSLSYYPDKKEVLYGMKAGIAKYRFENGKHLIFSTDTPMRCLHLYKYANKEFWVSKSHELLQKQNDGTFIAFDLRKHLDSAAIITNFIEYNRQLLITTLRHGTLVYDFKADTFIKDHPIFGSINAILAIGSNPKYGELIIGTREGLVTLAQNPVTFKTLKDSLPSPVHGCHAIFHEGSKKYYYVSAYKLIEFELKKSGYQSYNLASYFADNDNITLDLFNQDNIIIYGLNGYVFFNTKTKTIYQKAIFNSEIENLIKKDLIIDTYHSPNGKTTVFSTYFKGLFIQDKAKDTQYCYDGSKLGMFNIVCTIYPIGDNEFLMGAHGFGGAYYLNINNFKTKFFSPSIFDSYSVSRSYIRNIFELNGSIYFTAGAAVWEYKKQKNEILFSPNRNQITDGVLFNQTFKESTFLAAKNHIYLLNKDGISIVHKGNDNIRFAFLIPVEKGVGVYSGHKILFINHGNQFNNFDVYISYFKLSDRLKLCTDLTKTVEFKYNDPLLNLSFLSTFPHFAEFGGKIFYKINNINTWQVLEGNDMNLSGFKPGKYHIEYYAKLKGEITKIRSMTLIIHPPWYLHPLFWTIIGVLLVILAIIWVKRRIKNIKQKKRKEIELVLNSLEAERSRLSKDLHDGVSPNLSALKMVLSNANLDSSKFIMNPEKLIDATLAEIKEILHNITPETLKENGLASTISSFITNAPYSSIKIKFNSTLLGMRFDEAIEINLYRIFQELFNNAIKYAGSKEMDIDLFIAEKKLCFMMADHGRGFDLKKKSKGFGLQNIHSRLELINGTIIFDVSEQSGTTVILKIPLNENL